MKTYLKNHDNFSLIFLENPIARCYLNCLLDEGMTDLPIIYLGKYSSFKLSRRYKFHQNNYHPLNFLKDKSIGTFINEVEDFFKLRKNFFKDAYSYENLNLFNNISFINSNSINSPSVIKNLHIDGSDNYLISYQEILKNVFDTKKNFYHIHPGYLPKVKGADGSLHSVINHNELGASFFKLVKKIDAGQIIHRKLFQFKKISLKGLKKYNNSDLYRLWFSFFDPALRCSVLIDFLNKKFSLDEVIKPINNETSNYYTFMKDEERTKVFKKIFL